MSPRSADQLAQLRLERRAAIVQAALNVFALKGYHNANVSDVAKEAGVSQGTIYHYFPDKEALFVAAYEAWEIQSFEGSISEACCAADSPVERLYLLADTVATRMQEADKILFANVEFWSHLSRNERVREGFARMFAYMRDFLARIVQDAIDKGLFVETDPKAAASLLIAVFDGLVLQKIADPEGVDWASETRTLLRIFIRGLKKEQDQGEYHA